jgi:pyruvate dehydrogenase E2 component (dihydrolipoamide acetyltransferase)
MAEFVMPILGADMSAGTLLSLRKQPGDAVHRGDIIAEVETDKADVEVEVFLDGVVERLLVEPGTEVPVGTPLALIREEGAAAAPVPPPAVPAAVTPAAGQGAIPSPVAALAIAAAPARPGARAPEAGRRLISPAARRLAEEHGLDLSRMTGTGPGGRIQIQDVERALAVPPPHVAVHRTSPVARQMAAALGIDLATVQGTGPDGRITRHDVERAAARAAPVAPVAPSAPAPPAAPAVPPTPTAAPSVPPRPPATPAAPAAPPPAAPDRYARMRQAIAAAMIRSSQEVPQFQLLTTIDMSRPLAWLTAENERRPVAERLLYGVLLIKAVALALREVPELNATWSEEQVVLKPDVHVGVAIALRGGGLVAPALRHTDKQSVDELMRNFRDLVQRARALSLRSSELSDPTITVTSLGERGVETVFGLVFPPQAAIAGFGTIVERPWSVDGQVVSRPLLNATLSADHRVSDGHRGSLFLAAVDRLLQEPEKL